MCRKGELRIDGARCKPATRIEAGQEVRIPPIPAPEHREERPKQSRISDQDRQMIQDAVIYMDDHLIVLNKPAGLPSQGGSKQVRHVDGLAEALKYDRDENHVWCIDWTKTRLVCCFWRDPVRSQQP